MALEKMPKGLWARANAISGWLTRREGDLLYSLCRSPWCELGSWAGRSAVILAARGPGTCVDWFREGNQPSHLEDNVPSTCTILHSDFRDAADLVEPGLRFLHLDADHSYAATKEAWDLYMPKLEPGGHVVIHDAWVYGTVHNPWPECTMFVEELMADQEGNGILHVYDVERSAAFRKL